MTRLEAYWYEQHRDWRYAPMLMLSWLYCAVVILRKQLYRWRLLRTVRLPVPVIVVGNITAGGTGKTPLVIWLANFLKQQGMQPGIISRGYRGQASHWPQQVRGDSDYTMVGDEPVMIAARTECPMAVDPDRPAAARSLLEHHDIDVIIADDGLQHYALRRDIEIAVIDGGRRLGNGHCLPAGPLREPPSRLADVDLIVVNGDGERQEHPMQLQARLAVNLRNGETRPLSAFHSQTVHAVAGIGNPQRFFTSLREQGIDIIEHAFADHYPFQEQDLTFDDALPVLMTEKDAVKCVRLATDAMWCVPITAQLKDSFSQRLLRLLETASKTIHT